MLQDVRETSVGCNTMTTRSRNVGYASKRQLARASPRVIRKHSYLLRPSSLTSFLIGRASS